MTSTLDAFLDSHCIAYQRFTHPPVSTCEQARQWLADAPGRASRNLFLCDNKARQHFLVSVAAERSVDLRWLGQALGVKGVRFASKERLLSRLNVAPGAVTLLAVFNDPKRAVSVVIDRRLWEAPAIHCHPLVNTQTLVLPPSELTRFFASTGHVPRIIDLP